MSEYQYYEFQAIDKPLSKKQQDEIRDISSRAEITATSFVNEYHFGDFSGDCIKLMEKYYDAFLYYANWGSRTLMFKVPKRFVDWEMISQYCISELNVVYSRGKNLIFEFTLASDEPEDEFEEWQLSSMISLRSDLIGGDYRCLYLGWLNSAQNGEFADEEPEPPVPPGLNKLNASLQVFAEFLQLDPKLIQAAAKQSKTSAKGIDEKRLLSWIKKLSISEKERIVFDLMASKNQMLSSELIHRFKQETKAQSSSANAKIRFVGELLAEANR